MYTHVSNFYFKFRTNAISKPTWKLTPLTIWNFPFIRYHHRYLWQTWPLSNKFAVNLKPALKDITTNIFCKPAPSLWSSIKVDIHQTYMRLYKPVQNLYKPVQNLYKTKQTACAACSTDFSISTVLNYGRQGSVVQNFTILVVYLPKFLRQGDTHRRLRRQPPHPITIPYDWGHSSTCPR